MRYSLGFLDHLNETYNILFNSLFYSSHLDLHIWGFDAATFLTSERVIYWFVGWVGFKVHGIRARADVTRVS